MIALAIAAVSLLTMIGVYLAGYQLGTRSRDVIVSTELATEILEATRDAGFDRIPSGTATFDGRIPDAPDPVSGFPPSPFPEITLSGRTYPIMVEVAPQGPMKSVTVHVYYEEGRRVSLQTYFRP